MTMQPLFSHEGIAALTATLRQRPLLAFDFDGTLAPIVARPADARVSQAVSSRLRALAAQLPLAVVSGRAVADVRGRLGFEPHFVVGNHGAEGLYDDVPPADHALSRARARLQQHAGELAAAGVGVEDKGGSLALHYRLAPQRDAALATIERVLAPADPAWHVFGGKMVVNIAPAGAPDKATAVHTLVARCGAGSALFAGDDLNDEPVFMSAPPHWLTIRVGPQTHGSHARFCLHGPGEVALMLDRMLALLPALAGGE